MNYHEIMQDSLLYKCFKVGAFPIINEGFIGEKTAMKHIPTNFLEPHNAETTDRTQKVWA